LIRQPPLRYAVIFFIFIDFHITFIIFHNIIFISPFRFHYAITLPFFFHFRRHIFATLSMLIFDYADIFLRFSFAFDAATPFSCLRRCQRQRAMMPAMRGCPRRAHALAPKRARRVRAATRYAR
jgi:hypothetical protein